MKPISELTDEELRAIWDTSKLVIQGVRVSPSRYFVDNEIVPLPKPGLLRRAIDDLSEQRSWTWALLCYGSLVTGMLLGWAL